MEGFIFDIIHFVVAVLRVIFWVVLFEKILVTLGRAIVFLLTLIADRSLYRSKEDNFKIAFVGLLVLLLAYLLVFSWKQF